MYPKHVGSITNIDPVNGVYGSLSAAEQSQQAQKQQQYYQQVQLMQQQEQQVRQQQSHANYDALQEQQSRQSTTRVSQRIRWQSNPVLTVSNPLRFLLLLQRVYRAIYDYVAQDVDEVSFCEGDVIYEVESIDSGWMTGRVERTGKTGMLPANYVEKAVI